jgi:hypothetical protein
VLLSLAGDAVDLAIAAEATPEFRQVGVRGRYVFSVFERFTLRIKDPRAVVALNFEERRRRLRADASSLLIEDRTMVHFAHDGLELWYGTPDAPAPMGRPSNARGLGDGGRPARESVQRGERAVPRRRARRRGGFGATGGQ